MNDSETVRDWLNHTEATERVYDALDRIEAEVERLTKQDEHWARWSEDRGRRVQELEAEVARLQGLLGTDASDTADNLAAEVERLRDKYDECWGDWNAAANEVKRLKKKADWLVGALRAEEAVSSELQAEVERLRAQLEMYAGMPASEVEAREAKLDMWERAQGEDL